MMGRLTLVLGGARSGKSSYAAQLAKETGMPVVFIASALATDRELGRRIQRHKEDRPSTWTTIEAGADPVGIIAGADGTGILVIDCLTMMISGQLDERLLDGELIDPVDEAEALARATEIVNTIASLKKPAIVVSNEVGLGLVPPYPSGRLFRDLAGWANKELASHADEVFLMVAGIPMKVKP